MTTIARQVLDRCAEGERSDAVTLLPFYFIRRAHEEAIAAMVLIRQGLNHVVNGHARSILEVSFMLGALASGRGEEIARKYVAYELCVSRSNFRMHIVGTPEHTRLHPIWERVIPGLTSVPTGTTIADGVAAIDNELEVLGLTGIATEYEAILARLPVGLPGFLRLLGSPFRLSDLAKLAESEDAYRTIYWRLSETTHARDVVVGALRLSEDGEMAIAGPVRTELLATAINTLFPTTRIALQALCRIPVISLLQPDIMRIWTDTVELVERDLPER